MSVSMHKHIVSGFKSPAYGVLVGLWIASAMSLSGCGVTIYKQHPALQLTPETKPAKVYFIRPMPEKHKGIADSKIIVDYQGQKLLAIAEGTYTLLAINPGKGEITTHSKTMFTNRKIPIDVSRSRAFTFVAGGTYFIYLKRDNQEFRGIFYDPEPLTLASAKSVAQGLDSVGKLANREPIHAIKDIPPVPPTGPLEPVTPEQLYRTKSPYLLKKPVKK
jgi:hypothetical protein